MSDYTGMSAHYDLIMTSGYYDYGAVVDRLAEVDRARTVLEIGVGTGLVLERLGTTRPDLDIIGIDITPAMLAIAEQRLAAFPRITTHLQDVVTMDLGASFDLAFSYGGVWYFVPEDDRFTMISHIVDEQANIDGLERIAAHLNPGGTLMLGVQAPHVDYSRPVRENFKYSQLITSLPGGFRKHYSLADSSGQLVMEQTTDYRTYPFDDAIALLDKCGFEFRDVQCDRTPLFLEFTAR